MGKLAICFALMCTSLFALFWYRFRPLVRILLLVIFTILEAVLLIGINWTFATRCGMYAQFYLVLISAGIGIATPLSRSRAAMASWAFVAAASLILQPLVPAISINSLLNLVHFVLKHKLVLELHRANCLHVLVSSSGHMF